MLGVVYEPRGEDSKGRMAYVGWVTMRTAPVPSARATDAGRRLWVVHYDGRYRDFTRVVPRNLNDEPVETWLRAFEHGRDRNAATRGRAVRPLTNQDLATIFAFGFVQDLDIEAGLYPALEANADLPLRVGEQVTRLVTTAQREARFRDDVLAGYDRRCAVTGFSVGMSAPSRMFGLLDAAHIRPVWAQGPDSVTNGLALTPTLHRMFDRGLFTVAYERGKPVVVRSPRLEVAMVHSPDGSSGLVLESGRELLLPADHSLWPHPEALDYHRQQVFLRR
ncbi:MAG: putative restriction endonuclease [Chloroflexota bacterium]|jgi:putative restriction endonuclease|nr:putative restriction endonuclease [Chloroflexota bacterium]